MVATCDGGQCGTDFVASGTAIAAQITGDCEVSECDGAGGVVIADDDADLPDDNNACTADVCTAGAPSNPPLAAGMACGQGLVCDGNGACVGCVAPGDCPGQDTECQTRTCVAGACGFSFTAAGTPVAAQSPGDCQQDQCDGAGAVASAPLDADLPVDGNECTADVCTAGAPSNPPVASGAACDQGGGTLCDGAGACVECVSASTCPGLDTECQTRTCVAGACGVSFTPSGTPVAAQTAGDCQQNQCDGAGAVVSAPSNGDVPADADPCTADVCTAGIPSNPPAAAGTACDQNGGALCDGAGTCVACLAPSDCPGSDTACQARTCAAGACGVSFAAAGTACNQGGTLCDGAGTCVACLVASDCPGSDTECQARTCVASACGVTFTAAGTPVAAQTAGDCQQNQCDGAGAVAPAASDGDLPADGLQCTEDVCASGVPSNPPTAAGAACNQGGVVCSGAGLCVECVVGADCPSGVCFANACQLASCGDGTLNGTETDVDCGGGACPPCAPGDTCVGTVDCQSGVCTGNLCQPPAVVATTPADGATGAAVSSTVSVTFSTGMSPATLTAQTSVGACTGSIQVSTDDFATCLGFSAAAPVLSGGNAVATLTPAPALSYGTTYRVRVTTAATDASGNPLGAPFTSPMGFTTGTPPTGCEGSVVVSQVYGAGGNPGATHRNDFIELHNRGTIAVDLTGWSVQYASATGSSWQVTNLTGTLPAGGYYLVAEASGGISGFVLPAPQAIGTINMAAAAGKLALVSSTVPLTGVCPSGSPVVDFVGYGMTANCFEGAGPTPAPSTVTSVLRGGAGCTDTANNATNFTTGAPAPRNASTPPSVCGACGGSNFTSNESGAPHEADYCVLQFPPTLTVAASQPTPLVYGQIFEAGVTEAGGAAAGLLAQVGYGPSTLNPSSQSGWQYFAAVFNTQIGNNDEYQASFTAPAAPGTYRYTYRFSFDNGAHWTYCDLNGAGSNAGLGFEVTQLGTLTVNP